MPIQKLKPLTYGVMHFIVAIAVAYVLTGSWAIALSIGMVEPLIQTLAYAIHEKVWSKFPSGNSVSVSCGAHAFEQASLRCAEIEAERDWSRANMY